VYFGTCGVLEYLLVFGFLHLVLASDRVEISGSEILIEIPI